MAIFVEGVRGSGKSKIAVREIKTYLQLGLRVATNLDIKPDVLAPNAKSYITRLPDIPRSIDLELLGKAYPELDPDNPDTYDESRFGLIVIDELLTSFNSRSWNDKDRLAVVSWFVQSRKLGWRVWLLSQDVDAVDKQLRETLLQEIWHCRSGKNLFSSPILGKILNLFINPIIKITAPYGFHVLNVYNGKKKDRHHLSKTEFFKCYELHPAYKTSQQFILDTFINKYGKQIDMRASFTVLPANYFDKKEPQKIEPAKQPVPKKVNPLLKFGWQLPAAVLCFFAWYYFSQAEEPQQLTTANPTSQAPAPVNEVDEQQSNQQTNLSDFESTLESVVITCTVSTGKSHADFCFESDDGSFYPTDLGYKVTYLAPCAATITFKNESKLVKCRPHYVHSESSQSIAAVAPLPQDKT